MAFNVNYTSAFSLALEHECVHIAHARLKQAAVRSHKKLRKIMMRWTAADLAALRLFTFVTLIGQSPRTYMYARARGRLYAVRRLVCVRTHTD